MNKHCLSILQLRKILIYEFWFYYVKPKYSEKEKLCYMDIHIVYKKADDMQINILQKMLEPGLIIQIMNQTDHFLNKKIINWINEIKIRQ